ncbi:MtsA protein [Myxococcus qinghaiensis]|uniref:MtsA protein n=1 Tax=Myxococcus qinghaiensis TaxID=2906758 RepID=UPI0020A80DC2|nr:MtsA protein [Myxococcus qinghaiensis]MCP3162955.1 MtsA protein [Myxococcus qinghaiensis]
MLLAKGTGRRLTSAARRGALLAVGVVLWSAAGVVGYRLSTRGERASSPNAAAAAASASSGTAPRLEAVGPRLTSNETSQPLSIHGARLVAGLRLSLGPPLSRELPLTVVDSSHAFTRLPSDVTLPEDVPQVVVEVRLVSDGGAPVEGSAQLTVVNDRAFPDLTGMVASPDGRTLFIVSPPTDTVYSLDVGTGRVERLAVGDGPSALATWRDARGQSFLGVVHRYQPELRVFALDSASEPRVLPAPLGASGLEVDGAKGVAFVAEQVRDTVRALSLQDGREMWAVPVDPNPRALARWKDVLAVGSLQTGQLELLRQKDGSRVFTVVPGPGVAIVGGNTERFRAQVMGGKAPRALIASEKLGRLFMASLGPNVGPNPQRMEVSNNSGVAVIDPASGDYVRHRGFGAGVTEGLALDEATGLLYAADVGIGWVRVIDARALISNDDAVARGAVLQKISLMPPEGTPRIRPAEDFSTKGRAGEELHSGPRSLVLSPDGATLYVLNRFTREVAVVDVRDAGKKRPLAVTRRLPVVESRAQAKRRLGQVLYYADLGRTGITCDGCHIEGHTGGVFYEKTKPNRIYRSPTVLGSRDTPPFFTPASQHSLAETASFVGARNRFHNPDPSPSEVEALTLYTSLMATPPNPYRGADGAPLETVTLPDGHVGRPARGRALFEGRGGCLACHPAPLYTLDQDPTTRGQYLDVGTPVALPLRIELQDLVVGAAPPSLVGTWDMWPLLTSAAAGYAVKDGRLVVDTRFPLRTVLETAGPAHGDARAFSAEERDDVLAFLLTL